MKAHEETWGWHPRAGGGARLYSDNHEEEWASTWGDDSDARAKLAAQAPAMARLLLSLQWAGGHNEPYDSTTPCCPSCDADAPTPMPNGEAWAGVHTPDCALVTVLRAAGVIE